MKRREFGGTLLTAVAGLLVSGAALASGKRAATANEGFSGATSPTEAIKTSEFNPNSFYMTITTFFPYAMAHAEYKTLIKNCRNVEESEKLMNAMILEGKILGVQSKLGNDNVISCYEFCDEKAFREFEARFEGIPGNSSKLKKELGFHSKREFKRTVIS
jgi:hypothetical protein